MEDREQKAEVEQTDFREYVLVRALYIFALTAPLTSAIILYQGLAEDVLNTRTIVACGFTLLFPLLLFCRKLLGIRLVSLIVLGLILVMAFIVMSSAGVTAGPITLQLLALILAGLLLVYAASISLFRSVC